MPTYEYRCPKGHEFEHFFRTISSAESQMKCPECGDLAERRMSGGTGLLFKGSGFYITDYGKDGKKDQRKAAESTKAESGSESTKGESTKGEATKGESTKGESTKGESTKGESKSGGERSSKSAGESTPKKGSGSSDT